MIFRSKVKCARVFFVFFLVLFFSHNHAMAQANWYFAFGGRIEYTDEKKNKDLGLEGASATLIKGGNVVTTVTTGNNGKFSFKLEPASDYIISLTKAGFITKKFAISTKNVPDDRAVHPFAEWNIEVVIFQQYPGVDYSILNNPIAKIVYNPAKEVDDFDYDKAYTDQVKATLAKLEELARAAAELEKKYSAAMARAEKAFAAKDYTGAKAAYTEASGVKPAEQAPKEKIKECDAQIALAGASAKVDADYKAAMAAGDAAMAAKNYTVAKTAYTQAGTLKPTEQTPKDKLKALADLMKAEADKKGLEEKYKAALAKGDAAFGTKDYAGAKAGYVEASGLKPTEQYPKDTIKDCDTQIAQAGAAAKLDADYNAAIKKGDDAVTAKTYDAAKAAYTQAGTLKPAEQTPKDKLKALADLMKAEADKKGLEEKYKAALAKGDASFGTKDYANAKAAYVDASGLKPAEQYPKDRIKECETLIAQAGANAKADAEYQKAVAAGDIAFKAKKWDDAKTAYTSAQTVKPSEAYPKAQLKAIDEAIKAENEKKGLEEKYTNAISKADVAFKAKDYDNAKTGYTEALGYKPTEAYPKAQLKAIDEALKNSLKDKELNAQYLAALKTGDDAFAAKTYDAAKAAYVKASGLKPAEQMPKDKIKAIDDLLKAESLKKGLEEKYKAAIAKGDEAFKGTKYEAAKASFNEALTYKPDEQYPKDKLKELDVLLAKTAGDKLKNENYQKAIAAADIAYKAKKWADAKTGYTAALAIKSEEAYPKAQLAAMEEAIKAEQDKKGLEEKYIAAIAKGDAGFKGKDYDNAKAAYTEAMGYKPAEAYPKAQLKAIEDALKNSLKDKELNEQYLAAIKAGDEAFAAKTYEVAKAAFVKASGLKPTEQMPKDKIKAIDDLLKAELLKKGLEEKYKAAIAKGDEAFKGTKYEAAKASFNEALTYKPDEQYPKDKLKELDILLSKNAGEKLKN
jgi:tetratricopeptide (TPR) repeat protein